MPFDGYKPASDALTVLKRAREQVVQPGAWCQGLPEKGEARCVTRWVGVMGNGKSAATVRAEKALHRALPAYWPSGAISYNDAPGRTQGEIVALVDRAIALLEAENYEAH
jgi:hypothetical protein